MVLRVAKPAKDGGRCDYDYRGEMPILVGVGAQSLCAGGQTSDRYTTQQGPKEGGDGREWNGMGRDEMGGNRSKM